jgi:hypothetical protein
MTDSQGNPQIAPQPSAALCADISRQVGEPLFATATRVDVWLALEYDRAFGADAYPESDLPQAVKAHFDAVLAAIPRSRMQLIRAGKERPRTNGGVAFYVAVGQAATRQGHAPQLYKFRLAAYEDVLALDVAQLVAGDAQHADNLTNEPLFLICTNGKRDICCAKAGLPVYEAMSAHLGPLGLWESLWMTSHIGGHRFAATGVFLPHGICYGRIDPAGAAGLIEAHQAGNLALEYYRGLCGYDEPVQAADYFLRRELGIADLGAVTLIAADPTGEKQWRVTLSAGGVRHIVSVRQAPSTFQTYKNSSDVAGSVVPQYHAQFAG